MSEVRERLVRRLEAEGDKTVAFFEALPPESWDLTVYSEGACWSVHQILTHLVSAERDIARLVDHIVEGGDGVAEDFDLDEFNEQQVQQLEKMGPDELLHSFRELRAKTLSMVLQLKAGDLAREGRHPFLGVASVADILKLMYRHTQIHQRELRRALA